MTYLLLMIEVSRLNKTFGDFMAVRDVSFSIDRSHGITALLGPNGAGKTTTMRLLTGYLSPTSGRVVMNGIELGDEDSRVQAKRHVGYLPESTPLYPEMLVSEYLEFMGRVRGLAPDVLERNARRVIEQLELGSHLYSPIAILSKGFRQRVGLAATLIHDPAVIILDEPTSGLDPNQISHIRSLIKELGKERTLILSTHVLQEVEDVCDRVIIINRGKIVRDDSMQALRGGNRVALIARGENIIDTLRTFEEVSTVEARDLAGIPEGYLGVTCELKADNPERLFARVAGTGWDVREFRPLARSLEDIFHEFTA